MLARLRARSGLQPYLYFGAAIAPRGVWNLYLQLGRVF